MTAIVLYGREADVLIGPIIDNKGDEGNEDALIISKTILTFAPGTHLMYVNHGK